MNNPFEKLKAMRDALPPGPAPRPDEKPSAQTVLQKALRQKVVVRMERAGRGGRTITRVSGVVLPEAAMEDFVRDLKKALGCGASLEEGDVILQGDLRDRAEAHLAKLGAARVVKA
jgi:translation initiation factor 1